MKTLVVYDSMFGNTKTLAETVAGAVAGDCAIIHAEDVTPAMAESCDLLIIGCPTHAGHPTKPMQDFIDSLDNSTGLHFAAFDTRMPQWWAKVFGFAAGRMAKRLRKQGATLIGEPQGFFVGDKKGPILDGELVRAAQWTTGLVVEAN